MRGNIFLLHYKERGERRGILQIFLAPFEKRGPILFHGGCVQLLLSPLLFPLPPSPFSLVRETRALLLFKEKRRGGLTRQVWHPVYSFLGQNIFQYLGKRYEKQKKVLVLLQVNVRKNVKKYNSLHIELSPWRPGSLTVRDWLILEILASVGWEMILLPSIYRIA